MENLVSAKVLGKNRLITIGDIIGMRAADIEDLFARPDYITLYNAAFQATLSDSDLKGNDAIVSQIARHIQVPRFDHGKPADYFLRNRDKVLPNFNSDTLNNFEKLFETVNATLPA